MKKSRFGYMEKKRSCLPTEMQSLLLKATLLKGDKGTEAWGRWKGTQDLGDLDFGPDQVLLPLLYKNLKAHGVSDPLMDMFKDVYKATWIKNQLLFHQVSPVLMAFHKAGIPTMLLKGAALIKLYYKDPGLRPMSDFDVLVHIDHALKAIHLLIESGWAPENQRFPSTRENLQVTKAFIFQNEVGQSLDIHWHLTPEFLEEGAENDFWDHATDFIFHDVPTFVLNPADQLMHICSHGARWQFVPLVRWAADAMMILNNDKDEIDWNRLISHAKHRYLTLTLRDTLSFLLETLDAPLKPQFLKSIKKIPVSRIEHFEYKMANHLKDNIPGPFWLLRFHCLIYLRNSDTAGVIKKCIGFSIYLQRLWRIERLWLLPFYGIFKAIQILSRRIAG